MKIGLGLLGWLKENEKIKFGIIFSLFFILIFSSCDEYQNCIKLVELNIYPSYGSFVIGTLYTKYNTE